MSADNHEDEVKRALKQHELEGIEAKLFVPKKKKYLDKGIREIKGKRGACGLCGAFGDLSEDHVPPKCMGNKGMVYARSYMGAVAHDWRKLRERRFPKGVVFRTICHKCNNTLGQSEDIAIKELFDKAKWFQLTPIVLSNTLNVKVKPNLIFRGLMAHLLAANDQGRPDDFDDEVRAIFSNDKKCNETEWNLYYWAYDSPEIFLMRGAWLGFIENIEHMTGLYVLKIKPLAFAFSKKETFNLPNMREFLQPNDALEKDIPLVRSPIDRDPVWPIKPSDADGSIVFMSSASYGLIGRQR